MTPHTISTLHRRGYRVHRNDLGFYWTRAANGRGSDEGDYRPSAKLAWYSAMIHHYSAILSEGTASNDHETEAGGDLCPRQHR
jgi:hypothetical protein